MATVSSTILERARKNSGAILRALAEVSQVRVAELMGTHESTVSRMKDGEIDRIGALLAACGLKVAPEGAALFEQATVRALQTLARIGVERAAEPSGFGALDGGDA